MKKLLSYIPIIILLLIILLVPIAKYNDPTQHVSFSTFIQQLDAKTIKSVEINSDNIVYFDANQLRHITVAPENYIGYIEKLNETSTNYTIDKGISLSKAFWWIVFPIFVLGGSAILYMLYMLFKIGRSQNNLRGNYDEPLGLSNNSNDMQTSSKNYGININAATKEQRVIKFHDIAGNHEVKKELQTTVDFLKNPGKYKDMGAELPKGCILYGPPGTGKTLFARAVAGESDVPFFYCSASEFVEVYVGVGASRVRDIFAKAKAHAPAVLFIDELDAIGKNRSSGRDSERDQTINQLLVEMDGFDRGSPDKQVMVIAATNRFDTLDPALIRPGRFDKHINVDLPNRAERKLIFDLHLNNLPKISGDIDIDRLSKKCIGFSGADIRNTVNEAAIMTVTEELESVNNEMMDRAIDRVSHGTEEKSKMSTDINELKNTAYHESGHAILALLLQKHLEIDKVSIIPRSKTLGFVSFLSDDSNNRTKKQLLNEICILYGGRVGEELLAGEDNYTTGAYSDIKMATATIRNMVERFGMGPLILAYDEDHMVSESDVETMSDWSQKIAQEQYTRAQTLLDEHRTDFEYLAEKLLEKETILGDELNEMMSDRLGQQNQLIEEGTL